MATVTIEQTVVFDGSPQEIYEAYVDVKRHAAFTGAPAKLKKSAAAR